jgi:hypothetical protein
MQCWQKQQDAGSIMQCITAQQQFIQRLNN